MQHLTRCSFLHFVKALDIILCILSIHLYQGSLLALCVRLNAKQTDWLASELNILCIYYIFSWAFYVPLPVIFLYFLCFWHLLCNKFTLSDMLPFPACGVFPCFRISRSRRTMWPLWSRQRWTYQGRTLEHVFLFYNFGLNTKNRLQVSQINTL